MTHLVMFLGLVATVICVVCLGAQYLLQSCWVEALIIGVDIVKSVVLYIYARRDW